MNFIIIITFELQTNIIVLSNFYKNKNVFETLNLKETFT